MKKYIFALFASMLFLACGGSDNPIDKILNNYRSCKITKSGSILSSDQANDLSQCWNLPSGYGKTDALNWCEATVREYYDRTYLFLGNAKGSEFKISGSRCP